LDIVRDNLPKEYNKDYESLNNAVDKITPERLSSTRHLKTCDELFRRRILLTIHTPYNSSYDNLLLKQEKVKRNALPRFIEEYVRKRGTKHKRLSHFEREGKVFCVKHYK